ncbi:MAG: YdcF family protein [Verrucomicrobia bacterium]|nr:YdcF family protein [Verrucomicrobiota bacterium]
MMNWIRVLEPLSEPLALFWVLLCLSMLWFLRRKRWSCALIQGVFVGLVYGIGSTPLATVLLGTLEGPYARAGLGDLPVGDAVVMLGGAHRPSRYDVFGVDLTAAADRIVTAVEMMRLRKAGALVLGGGGYEANGQKLADGPLLEKWFTTWRLPVTPLFTLEANADTHDEAVHFATLAKAHGWKRILLVTSAFHMKRAAATFRKAGVAVVPVACDFRVVGVSDESRGYFLLPRREGFEQLELYLHERVGWWFYAWRDWLVTDTSQPAATNPGGGAA